MSKQIGDNLQSSIRRGGFTNIEWQITRAGTPTWETLLPCGMKEGLIETEIAKVGIDGRIHVQYYEQTVVLIYYQMDSETLADLFASTLDSPAMVAGIPTRFTMIGGQTETITMRWLRQPVFDGFSSAACVILTGRAVSTTPFLR